MARKITRKLDSNIKSFQIKYKKQKIQAYTFGNTDKYLIYMQPHLNSGISAQILYNTEIQPQYTTISIDIPGWIGKSNSTQTFTYSNITNIYKQLINYLKIKEYSILSFDVLTHSAIRLASENENTNKCILINPVFKPNNKKNINPKLSLIYSTILKYKIIKQISKHSDKEIIETYKRYIKNIRPKEITQAYNLYNKSDTYPYLSKLENTNLLIGDNSPNKEQLTYLRKNISNENIQEIYINKDINKLDKNKIKEIFKFLDKLY